MQHKTWFLRPGFVVRFRMDFRSLMHRLKPGQCQHSLTSAMVRCLICILPQCLGLTLWTDCIVPKNFRPNLTTLAEIHACQLKASSPFCWPLNGTRFCVNSEYGLASEITVYWPKDFYGPDTLLNIVYSTDYEYSGIDNTGNDTKYLTPNLYDMWATEAPGRDPAERPETGKEKELKIYSLQRKQKDKDDLKKGLLFEGPVLTLVKTDIWVPGYTNPRPAPKQKYCIFGENATCDRDSVDGDSRNGSNGSNRISTSTLLAVLCITSVLFATVVG